MKRLVKRFRQLESPLRFAGWLSILLIILVLAIITYCFYDKFPNGIPIVDLPVIPTSHDYSGFGEPREINFCILKDGTIKFYKTQISIDKLKNITSESITNQGVDNPIRIRADKNCLFKDMSPVINMLRGLKIFRLYFIVTVKDSNRTISLGIFIPPRVESKIFLQIEVKKDQILLNGKLVDNTKFRETLQNISSAAPDAECVIIPDPSITHQRMVDVIYECIGMSRIIVSDKAVPNEAPSNSIPQPAKE